MGLGICDSEESLGCSATLITENHLQRGRIIQRERLSHVEFGTHIEADLVVLPEFEEAISVPRRDDASVAKVLRAMLLRAC